MRIVKASRRNLDAWMDFFDCRAFADHQAWKTCYCTYYHYPKSENRKIGKSEAAEPIGRSKREYARWLLENGKMNGYLAYDDGKAIGWCNVGPKRLFPRLGSSDAADAGTKSIVCFIIDARRRRQGIARAMLRRIIRDSRTDGTKRIEAYPNIRARDSFGQYHGPLDLYLSERFVIEKGGNGARVTLLL